VKNLQQRDYEVCGVETELCGDELQPCIHVQKVIGSIMRIVTDAKIITMH